MNRFFYIMTRNKKACHYSKCHTITKRTKTGNNQKVNLIMRGNDTEAHKIVICSPKLLKISIYSSRQCKKCDIRLFINASLLV